MKKLLAMLLCLSVVFSCVAFAAAEEKTTLTVACWDYDITPYYVAIQEAYEAANPNVTIE